MKKTLGLALVAALAMAGCGGGSPLSVWKVSMIAGAKPASCFKDGKITDTKTEQTTIETYVGLWEMYPASNGTYQLRISDEMVLDGSANGGTYEFTGTKSVIVVDRPENPTVTTTTSAEEKVTLTMNGGSFTGEWAHTAIKRCEGTCSATFQADNPDCTVTDTIKGTQIPAEVVLQE